jgi:opacity protein-like surface antigen
MSGKVAVVGVFVILLAGLSAKAQDEPKQEISVQGTGFFTKNSTGNGVFQSATDTGGFLVGYRYHFNSWMAADVSYGYVRNTQQNFTSSSAFNVQADVHQATGAFVVTVPHGFLGLHPYVLAGAGALVFDPTGNAGGFVPGATTQARAAFMYGGGVDWNLTRHFALRAEYRGFVYERPDFDLAALHSGATTHTAQPSAGIVFRF